MKKRFHILITQNLLQFWFIVLAKKNELFEKMQEKTCVSSSENVYGTQYFVKHTPFFELQLLTKGGYCPRVLKRSRYLSFFIIIYNHFKSGKNGTSWFGNITFIVAHPYVILHAFDCVNYIVKIIYLLCLSIFFKPNFATSNLSLYWYVFEKIHN